MDSRSKAAVVDNIVNKPPMGMKLSNERVSKANYCVEFDTSNSAYFIRSNIQISER